MSRPDTQGMSDLIFGICIGAVVVFVLMMGWWKWLLGATVVGIIFVVWAEYQFMKIRRKVIYETNKR